VSGAQRSRPARSLQGSHGIIERRTERETTRPRKLFTSNGWRNKRSSTLLQNSEIPLQARARNRGGEFLKRTIPGPHLARSRYGSAAAFFWSINSNERSTRFIAHCFTWVAERKTNTRASHRIAKRWFWDDRAAISAQSCCYEEEIRLILLCWTHRLFASSVEVFVDQDRLGVALLLGIRAGVTDYPERRSEGNPGGGRRCDPSVDAAVLLAGT